MPVYTEEELFTDCETKSAKVSKLKSHTFAEVFLALKNYIDDQIENGKACSIGGFGKWTFKSEKMDLGTQGVVEKRIPVFLLSENFARANNLRVSKPFVSSEIPVTEVNYFLLAQRASTLKEVVTAVFKIMLSILGDRMSSGRQVSMDFKVGKLTCDKKMVEFHFAPKYAEPVIMRKDSSTGASVPVTPAGVGDRPATIALSRGRLMSPSVVGAGGEPRVRTSAGLFQMPSTLGARGSVSRSETNVMTIHHDRDALDEIAADAQRLTKSLDLGAREDIYTPSKTYDDYYDTAPYLEEQIMLKEEFARRKHDEYLVDGERVAKNAQMGLIVERQRQEEKRRELMAIADENKKRAAEKTDKDKSDRTHLFGTDFSGLPKGATENKFYMPYEDEDEMTFKKAVKSKQFRESLDSQIQLRQAMQASRLDQARADQDALENELADLQKYVGGSHGHQWTPALSSPSKRSELGSPSSRASSNVLAASIPSSADTSGRRLASETLISAAMDEAMVRQMRANHLAAEAEARARIHDEKAIEAGKRYEMLINEEKRKRDTANAEVLKRQMAESQARKQMETSERKLASADSLFRGVDAPKRDDERQARTRTDLMAQMEANEKRKQKQREADLAMELAMIERANRDLEEERKHQLARKMESTAILAESWKRQMELRTAETTPASGIYSPSSRGSLR